MGRVGQYHLKAVHKEAWKLIRHIRFLVNQKALKQISHEGTEDDFTYVCIILKSRVSLATFAQIEQNLKGSGLKMI